MTKTKFLPDTYQGVRGLLKKAGFESSQSHTTRIRGYHSNTDGMTVKASKYDSDYVAKISYYGDAHEKQLDAMEKVLQDAGYTVVRGGEYSPSEHLHHLWVRQPTDQD